MLIILIAFCLLLRPVVGVATLATVGIYTYAGYLGLRNCAGQCVYTDNFLGSGLQIFIGCGYPVYNACYCNSNIVSSATSFLSSCISSACNEVADVPDAVTAWEGYCSSVGLPVIAAAQTTALGSANSATSKAATGQTYIAPTVALTSAGTGPSPTVSGGSGSTVTGSSGSAVSGSSGSAGTPAADNPGASSSSNLGPIIGGVVGGAGILGIAGIVITVLVLRHRRQMREQQLVALPVAGSGMGPPFPPQPPTSDKILKTPATVHSVPLSVASQDAIARTTPEAVSPINGGNPELQGRPWRPGTEMDATGYYNQGPHVFEMKG